MSSDWLMTRLVKLPIDWSLVKICCVPSAGGLLGASVRPAGGSGRRSVPLAPACSPPTAPGLTAAAVGNGRLVGLATTPALVIRSSCCVGCCPASGALALGRWPLRRWSLPRLGRRLELLHEGLGLLGAPPLQAADGGTQPWRQLGDAGLGLLGRGGLLGLRLLVLLHGVLGRGGGAPLGCGLLADRLELLPRLL
eukprot:9417452-Pyramimonas_sp.AAC.1